MLFRKSYFFENYVWDTDSCKFFKCARLWSKRSRFEPWPGTLCTVVFLGKSHFTLTVPLSTQVYKWVPANLMVGVTL